HSVAVGFDPRHIVVANDYGAWRSVDGGLSWSSLNENLPNLPIRRLLPPSTPGTMRAVVDGVGQVELPPAAAAAHANWIRSVIADPTEGQRHAASLALQTEITAFARTATTWFAGSADGRMWTSIDGGKKWDPSPQLAAGRVDAIETGGEN